MNKIELFEASAQACIRAGVPHVQMPVRDILKMCAVIKAAQALPAVWQDDDLRAALQELNND